MEPWQTWNFGASDFVVGANSTITNTYDPTTYTYTITTTDSTSGSVYYYQMPAYTVDLPTPMPYKITYDSLSEVPFKIEQVPYVIHQEKKIQPPKKRLHLEDFFD